MWGNSIASRVNKVIKQRVADAQREHNEVCTKLDERFEEAVTSAEIKRDEGKELHAQEMVNKIIGR